MHYPPVTVVVPVYNDAATLAACVRSVLAHTKYLDWELLVVDDGSTDGGPQTLAQIPGVRILKKPRGGVASALNAGFAAAAGRDVVRLHADVVIETPDWLEQLVAAAQAKPKAAVVGVRLLYPDGRIQSEGRNFVTGFGFNFPQMDRKIFQADGANAPVCEVDAVSGALAYYRREALDRVGGLDECYGPAWLEDDDYCMAVRQLGYKVFVHGGVKAVHFTRSCPPFIRAIVADAKAPVYRWTHLLKDEARRVQCGYWEAKWGWNPHHPDLSEVRRLYGHTEIGWQIGESLRFKPTEEFPAVDCCMVTWNNLNILRRTLESLAQTDYPVDKVQVYVTDNGSTDGTIPFLDALTANYRFRLHLIKLPLNTGVATGVNSAVLVGKSDLVARLDDDIVLPPQWLKGLLADLRARPFAGCVAPKTVNDDERAAIQWGGQFGFPNYNCCGDEPDVGQSDRLIRQYHVPGCCTLYRREVFARAGLLDIRYSPTQLDDIDHGLAVFHAGYESLYDGRIAIVHKRITGLDQSTAGMANAAGNNTKLFGKWGKRCVEVVDTSILYSREGRVLPDDGDTAALLAQAPAPSEFPRQAAPGRAAMQFVLRCYDELSARGGAASPTAKLGEEFLVAASAQPRLGNATELAAMALCVGPADVTAYRALALVLHRSGHTKRAVLIARNGLHIFPEDPTLRELAALTWSQFAARYPEVGPAAPDMHLPMAQMAEPAVAPADADLRVLMVHSFEQRIATEEVGYLRQLAQQLRTRGVHVDVCGTAHPDPRAYDVVHFWGTALPFHLLGQMAAARTQAPEVPRILSPWLVDDRAVAWDSQAAGSTFVGATSVAQLEQKLQQLAAGTMTFKGMARPGAEREVFKLGGRDECLAKVFQAADAVLVGSREESELIAAISGEQVPGAVVPTAAAPEALHAISAAPFVERYGVKDFILAVGPIEATQNQAMLLFAALTLHLPVVIVGPVANSGYAKICRDLAPTGTLFIPHLTPELYASALKAARVFVLSTWAAATAPHAVEAGLAGCALVLSDGLMEKEPFGAEASFFPPNNYKALRDAVAKAHRHFAADAPKRARMQERLAAHCSWTQIVEHTLAVYRTVIAQRTQIPAGPAPELAEQLG